MAGYDCLAAVRASTPAHASQSSCRESRAWVAEPQNNAPAVDQSHALKASSTLANCKAYRIEIAARLDPLARRELLAQSARPQKPPKYRLDLPWLSSRPSANLKKLRREL